MKKGPASFLTSRPAAEAFETVRRVYVEEGCLLRKTATRLHVGRRTLRRFLIEHPEYEAELEALRAKSVEPEERES